MSKLVIPPIDCLALGQSQPTNAAMGPWRFVGGRQGLPFSRAFGGVSLTQGAAQRRQHFCLPPEEEYSGS